MLLARLCRCGFYTFCPGFSAASASGNANRLNEADGHSAETSGLNADLLQPAFILENALKQCCGGFNCQPSSRLSRSDQHFLYFPPSGSETERFRKILIDQINSVSEGANSFGMSATVGSQRPFQLYFPVHDTPVSAARILD